MMGNEELKPCPFCDRDHNTMQIMAEAMQSVVDRWYTPLWKDVEATAIYIRKLEHALEEYKKTESQDYCVSSEKDRVMKIMAEALEGSNKLIGNKVISNVMPNEQDANYKALAEYDKIIMK